MEPTNRPEPLETCNNFTLLKRDEFGVTRWRRDISPTVVEYLYPCEGEFKVSVRKEYHPTLTHDGVETTKGYDPAKRHSRLYELAALVGYRHKTGTPLLTRMENYKGWVYSYAYDGQGRITSASFSFPELEHPFTAQFTYDDQGRLLSEVYNTSGQELPHLHGIHLPFAVGKQEYVYDTVCDGSIYSRCANGDWSLLYRYVDGEKERRITMRGPFRHWGRPVQYPLGIAGMQDSTRLHECAKTFGTVIADQEVKDYGPISVKLDNHVLKIWPPENESLVHFNFEGE